MEIRKLTEHDADPLWRLRLTALESDPQAFRETADQHRQTTLEAYAERLRTGGDHSFVFGAYDEGALIGMVGLYRKELRSGCVWGMFVAPQHRGSGVGRALMHALLEHVRTLPEIERVHLTVALGQTAARSLYVQCGFRRHDGDVESSCGPEIPADQEQMVFDLLQQRK